MRSIKPLLRSTFLLVLPLLIAGCRGGALNSNGSSAAASGKPASAASVAVREDPLEVGNRVPDFETTDQLGRPVSSAELCTGKGSAVFVLPPAKNPAARPAIQWAKQYHNLLSQRGVELLLVVPGSAEDARILADSEGLRFAVLADPTGMVARTMGNVPKGQKHPVRSHLYVFGGDARVHFSDSGGGDPAMVLLAAENRPGVPRGSAIPFF